MYVCSLQTQIIGDDNTDKLRATYSLTVLQSYKGLPMDCKE